MFPAYRMGSDNMVYSHPENFVAQWISEWGIPVALAAFCALAWALRPRNMGAGRDAAGTAVCVAVAALLLQNMFDLALEVPAVPILVAATVGACFGATAARRSELDPEVEHGSRQLECRLFSSA